MKKLILLCTLLIAGCATNKTFEAIGGSKADATIKLAYEYGVFEKPVVNWDLADSTARQRCAAWGYKNAQRFTTTNHCISYNGYGNCIRTQVNVVYQCL